MKHFLCMVSLHEELNRSSHTHTYESLQQGDQNRQKIFHPNEIVNLGNFVLQKTIGFCEE
jgi:hypothetical protein